MKQKELNQIMEILRNDTTLEGDECMNVERLVKERMEVKE